MKQKMKQRKIVKTRSSIKTRLIGAIVPVVVFSILVVVVIFYISSKNSISDKTKSLVRAEAQAGINKIVSWENENLAIMETLTTSMRDLHMTEKEILDYLILNLDRYKEFPNGMYIIYEDDHLIDGTGWIPDEIPTQASYYLEGLEHERFSFGEPYFDSYSNEYVVTASKKLPNFNGEKNAVAAVDISLRVLTDTINGMNIAGSGDAFIIDASSGMILAHRDSSMVGTLITDADDEYYQNIYSNILSGNLTEMEYTSNDGTYITSILPISKTDWCMIGRVKESIILRDLNRLNSIIIGVSIVILAIMFLLIERLVAMIIKPINRLTNTIIAITGGDFTQNIEIKGKDEITVMSSHMQQFLVVMRDMLGKMRSISDNLNDKALNSSALSEELYKSAGAQSNSMEQLNSTVEELVRAIMEIADNSTSLAQIVSDTNESGNTVMTNMKETRTAAEQGRTDMNHVNKAMGEIETSMAILEKSIQDVGASAVKIDEITNTISQIAEETNLLALNASIEAARAGEAGRGFSVVANQIKKLAETSAAAADEISGLIVSVSSLINDTVAKSQNSMSEIKGSSQLVNVALGNFNHIYESINTTNSIIENMIVKIKEVDDVATSVAAITEEQSASAEEIEATTIEMNNLAATVADNSKSMASDSQNLTEVSKELKSQISNFKI